MRAENDPAAIGDKINVVDKSNTARAEAFNYRCIMYDFVKDIKRRAAGFQCPFDCFDSAGDAGTKALCSGEKNFHFKHPDVVTLQM